MFVHNTIRKEITCNENGNILCEYTDVNSVSFFAKLPKSAVVDHVKVDGVYLEDIKAKKLLDKPMESFEGEFREVATITFIGAVPEIFDRLANHVVTEFEVFYHLEAVAGID